MESGTTAATPELAGWDVILVNSSAGKDSQAMLHVIVERAKAEGVLDRVQVVHATFDEEWAGTEDLARTIFGFTLDQVWSTIKAAGTPVHPAYGLGMPRLSCVFCVFAPKSALMLAGKHNPELLEKYVALEQEMGHTFTKKLPIAEVQAALARGEEPGEIRTWEM